MRWWDNEIGKIFAFHKINRLWFTHLHVFSVRGGAKVYLLNKQWVYIFFYINKYGMNYKESSVIYIVILFEILNILPK